jgi:rubredoxin
VSIEGKEIVFTGKISRPRHEFQHLVESHGGIFKPDLTRNTAYLVVGEKPGSKFARATLQGIKTISEQDLLSLINAEPEETSLTPAQLAEIEASLEERLCSNCGYTYRQWKTRPDTNTCHVCELLVEVECPHCKDSPTYVEDLLLYHCMTCGLWFKAPFSARARKTKHLHAFLIRKPNSKTCIGCGYTIPSTKESIDEENRKYREAPEIVKRWKELRRLNEEAQNRKRREEQILKYLESLTPYQIAQLEEKLGGNRVGS